MLISIIRTQCVSDTVFVLLPDTLLDINKLLDRKMLKGIGNAQKVEYEEAVVMLYPCNK